MIRCLVSSPQLVQGAPEALLLHGAHMQSECRVR